MVSTRSNREELTSALAGRFRRGHVTETTAFSPGISPRNPAILWPTRLVLRATDSPSVANCKLAFPSLATPLVGLAYNFLQTRETTFALFQLLHKLLARRIVDLETLTCRLDGRSRRRRRGDQKEVVCVAVTLLTSRSRKGNVTIENLSTVKHNLSANDLLVRMLCGKFVVKSIVDVVGLPTPPNAPTST